MNRESGQILINNLIGFSLGVIAIVSFTAGLPFELLILGSVVAVPFVSIQIIKQPTWVWRIIFVGLLIIPINSFNNPAISDGFKVSIKGFWLTTGQIEDLKWLAPYAAGICLASFWIAFISTIKKNKKTLPNNV